MSKLVGFDNDWVDMGNISIREFTNLKKGAYDFQIKAVNAWGGESKMNTFSFRILPPWYFSLLAFIFYGLFVVFAFYLFVRYTLQTIKSSQKKYREQQEKEFAERNRQMKIESLEAEKEVIRLRNDKLRTEKKQKDMELANTTMQIIQTSKALSSIKTDLQMLQKELGSHSAVARVQRILKKVNRNIDSDKQWEVFEKHFTGVHEEFLQRLKDNYPDLSPRELKLCAYLRLNISSKEIADLMNISVRGVEISRYRLRKKLQLEHDQNLTDFIIKY
jgi:DNA-binding CsgD family transcriptional regulator